GPDGNLWFSASTTSDFGASARIGRITPDGAISEFALPVTYSNASALTDGPDGSLWFSDRNNSSGATAIGRITPTGSVSEYPLSTSLSSVSTLTVAPDGNLWFTETGTFSGDEGGSSFQMGQITPSGVVTTFDLVPTFVVAPGALRASPLTVGPD